MTIYIPWISIKIILFLIAVVGWFKVYATASRKFEKSHPASSVGGELVRGPTNLLLFLIPVFVTAVVVF